MAYCRKPHSGRHPPLSKFMRAATGSPSQICFARGRRSSSRLPSAGIRRRVLRLVDAVALLAARALVVALPLLGLCLASLGFARRCRSSRHALACRLGRVARFARHITLARLARSPHSPIPNNSQLSIPNYKQKKRPATRQDTFLSLSNLLRSYTIQDTKCLPKLLIANC